MGDNGADKLDLALQGGGSAAVPITEGFLRGLKALGVLAKVCHGKKKHQKNMLVWGRGGLELASQNGDVRGAALDSERLRAALGSDDESALRWAQSEFALR